MFHIYYSLLVHKAKVLTAKQMGPGLLGCYVMSSGTSQHGCQHDMTYQETWIFISTNLRTSNLKYLLPVCKCIFASVITFYYGIISHVTPRLQYLKQVTRNTEADSYTAMKRIACNNSRQKAANQTKDWGIIRRSHVTEL
jgi:hypothetical protein